MSVLARWVAWHTAGAGAPLPACATCRHFERDPRAIEAALPGLAVLSSASASVLGDDGLCEHHARFASARSVCAAFAPRDAGR